ncbi:MAG TPA: hypothetical protein VN207_00465 [Ktedonobacteraceae bacterium]|nr:hypothetical protein [Ktedonobacteraceae bacterium]
MRSSRNRAFRKLFARLPLHVQKQADAAFRLFEGNPYHPSLHFKCINQQSPLYSVRVGRGYRAVGWYEDGVITWRWIGSHADYDHLF